MALEVIAEWGQTHGGDVGVAVEQAHATADMGARIAKYQIFDPAKLASGDAQRYWASHLGGDDSQLQTFTDNGALTADEWLRVATACIEAGVEFAATPFDLQAVDLLLDLGARTFKVASGDITYRQLIEKIAATGKRCLMSTGASTLQEVEQAIDWFEAAAPPPEYLQRRDWAPHSNLVLLACDLAYPTIHPELGKIKWLSEYGRTVGYSDHTLAVDTGRFATRAGARVLEKHCTLNPGGHVPDDHMALTVDQMSVYIREARAGLNERDLVLLGDHEMAAREQARRSIHMSRPVRRGERILTDAVVFLRPCPEGALPPDMVNSIVGRYAVRDLETGERITLEHTAQHEAQLRIAA